MMLYPSIKRYKIKRKAKNISISPKKTDDLGKFADIVRLSDLGIDPSTAYHLYCAETISHMNQNKLRNDSISALLKCPLLYEVPS